MIIFLVCLKRPRTRVAKSDGNMGRWKVWNVRQMSTGLGLLLFNSDMLDLLDISDILFTLERLDICFRSLLWHLFETNKIFIFGLPFLKSLSDVSFAYDEDNQSSKLI